MNDNNKTSTKDENKNSNINLHIEKHLSLKQFLNINPSKVFIEVPNIKSEFMITTYEVVLDIYEFNYQYTVFKRYTEFAGLYDSLKIRFQNISLPEFPSKFQVFQKKESRKLFFNNFLKSILSLAVSHQESKQEILNILYIFLIESATEEKGTLINCYENKEYQIKKENFSKFTSISSDNINRKQTVDSLYKGGNDSDKFIINTPKNMFENIEIKDFKGWNIEYDFLRKGITPDLNISLVKGFLKIDGNNIMIMENITSNNFFIIMPLWRIKCEFFTINENIMHIENLDNIKQLVTILKSREKKNNDLKLQDILENAKLFIRLKHDNDKSDLIICLSNQKNDKSTLLLFLENVLSFLNNQSTDEEEICKWKYIQAIDDTNYYNYGKLSLDIDDIIFKTPYDMNLFFKIILDPYHYKSKTVISKDIFLFKQRFLIPIHNRFEQLKIEIYIENNSGFFHKNSEEIKIFEFKIKIPDVINYEYDNNGANDKFIYDKEADIRYVLKNNEKGKIYSYIPIKNLKLDEKIKKLLPNYSQNHEIKEIKEINNSSKDEKNQQNNKKSEKIENKFIKYGSVSSESNFKFTTTGKYFYLSRINFRK